MPPVHPAIVHFSIALLALSFVADLIAFLTDSASLRGTGWWALAGAAGALLAGLFDMNRQHIPEHVHPRVHTHMKVGLTLFASVAALTLWRWLSYTRARRDPGWGYVALAFAALALTLYQGSLGSRLVYENGIGVTPLALRAPAARKSSGHRESPGHNAAKAESRSGGHGGH